MADKQPAPQEEQSSRNAFDGSLIEAQDKLLRMMNPPPEDNEEIRRSRSIGGMYPTMSQKLLTTDIHLTSLMTKRMMRKKRLKNYLKKKKLMTSLKPK